MRLPSPVGVSGGCLTLRKLTHGSNCSNMKLSPFSPRLLAWLVSPALITTVPTAFGQKPPVEAEHGMVTSVQVLASEAGREILRQGGNAVDAAVATAFALQVVYPFAGNLGGGGFMMPCAHLASGRKTFLSTTAKTAPAAASVEGYVPRMPDGKARSFRDPQGALFGWRGERRPRLGGRFRPRLAALWLRKMTWAELIEPARKLAADGHVITAHNADLLKRQAASLAQNDETKRIYLNGGKLWKEGDLFLQPDLAATLGRLQKNGPVEFYEGETAHRIADAMATHGGTITLADLKAYRALERAPIQGRYRGASTSSRCPRPVPAELPFSKC